MNEKQQRVVKAIDYLRDYMNTYPNQAGYEDYTDQIIIDDVLYGLGVALYGDECKWHGGFEKFKEKLLEHLNKDK